MTPTQGQPRAFRWLTITPLLGVVCVAALIIVPVPTAVVDSLITLNLAGATVLLLTALSARSVRALSALPGLLLLTTLFRLALNVSTTRLILVQADAGGVVAAFGEFVVAGSYLVGGVVFAILTVVQYVVIASGAGRVAEVAARFALDALPGAQAAIDADLRSGAIARPEAERRRQELHTESRLYGAMDGAMRFVRGDAVAALLITAVNLVGGIAVGALTHDMPASEALRTYGLLTIGDGLAAQIPAVLISVAAGLAVTRVDDPASPGGLPEAAARQLGRTPIHIIGAGGLLIGLGLIPGLPTAPFLAMGSGTSLLGWVLARRRNADGGLGEGRTGLSAAARLELHVGPDLLRCIGGAQAAASLAAAAAHDAADPLRWSPPNILVGAGAGATTRSPALGSTHASRVAALGPDDLGPGDPGPGDPGPGDPGPGDPGHDALGHSALGPDAWRLDLDGVQAFAGVLDPSTPTASADALRAELTRALRALAPELVDVQAVSDLVDGLSETHPALTREALDRRLTLPHLTRLVSLLLAEGLPAGDLRAVLDAVLAIEELPGAPPTAGPRASAIVATAEAIRPRFRRHLTAAALVGRSDSLVPAHTLDESLLLGFEEHAHGRTGRDGRSAPDPSAAAPLELSEALRRACAARFGDRRTPRPVLFVPRALRFHVSAAVGASWRHVMVLGPTDLDPAITVEPAGAISDPASAQDLI